MKSGLAPFRLWRGFGSTAIGSIGLLLLGAAAAHADQRFQATLTGAQQVPAVATSATGAGAVRLDASETHITIDLGFSGLSSNATAAHIHGPAAAGSNADIVFPFTGVPSATSGAIPQQTVAITPTQVAQLKAGQFYFNIHTAMFSGGEIRGQIQTAPPQTYGGTLSGQQQVPPTGSTATGRGTVALDAIEQHITVNLSFSGLSSNANAGHIHGPAGPGANAGVLFPFTGVPAATSGAIPEQTFDITPEQVSQLRAGQFYFNVHSDNFGGGEIRAQIILFPVLTVTMAGNGPVGTVTSTPAGIACGGDCTEPFESGTMVALAAGSPPAGSFFAGWSGGGCSVSQPCVLALTADTIVTAIYSTSSFTFTDDPLSAGGTVVKAAHILELRAAVNTLRTTNGLLAFAFTDPTLTAGTTPIRAVHVAELRTALGAVYVAKGRTLPAYTDAGPAGGTTVKAVHVAELRVAVRAIE